MSHSQDFKLDITKLQKGKTYYYLGCVTYVGDNPKYKEAITNLSKGHITIADRVKKQHLNINITNYSPYCVFEIYVTVNFHKNIEIEYPDFDEGVEATLDMPSDCHIEYLSNNTYEEKSLSQFEENKRLKGLGRAMLCMILRDIVNNNILNLENIITVEAGESSSGYGIKSLIAYYSKLGFTQFITDEAIKQYFFDEGRDIPMIAYIADVLNACIEADYDYSESVRQIMRDVEIK